MSYTDRVIVLVDMDCFYCQVEEGLDPSLKGKPIAVVQYNAWRGGGIIAVNYLARERGVTRHMRGNEAKKKCPEIALARVPEVRGKAGLSRYREAGKRVADVLQTFTPILERASVDEAYLDITEIVKKRVITDFHQVNMNNLQNTFVVGYDTEDFIHNITTESDYSENNKRLAMGGLVAEEIRAEVFRKTGYKCSAGVAHNRILAKLVCGLHKPNKQTILPHESVAELYKDLPVSKVTGLGGKFGTAIVEQLKISKMSELIQFSERQLSKVFDEKTAKWLYNIARGIDYEPVTSRLLSKSISSRKNFPGKSALLTAESVEHWVNELSSEIAERLEKDISENNRRARQITVHFTQPVNGVDVGSSRIVPLHSYEQSKIEQTCLAVLKRYCLKSTGNYNIKHLGFSASNFTTNKKIGNISELFKNMKEKQNLENETLPMNFALENTEANTELQDDDFDDNSSICEDNTSIYSADTDELNEDTTGLIYYDDVYTEDFAVKPILTQHNTSISSEDQSKSDTEVSYFNEDLLINQPSTSSFFSKYFEQHKTDDSCDSPVKRNFDTSRILEELEHSDERVTPQNNEQEDSMSPVMFKKQEAQRVVNPTEICPECKKNISLLDFTSHMDYHYALKIVKDEAHLYKPTPSNPSSKKSPKQNNVKQGTKKKIVELKQINPFLKNYESDRLNEENSEFCRECNKRIKFDDLDVHTDYHAAKKLHLELNSKPSVISDKNVVAKTVTKAKNKIRKNEKNMGSIYNFLNSGGV